MKDKKIISIQRELLRKGESSAATEHAKIASQMGNEIYEVIQKFEDRLSVVAVLGTLDIIKWAIINDAAQDA